MLGQLADLAPAGVVLPSDARLDARLFGNQNHCEWSPTRLIYCPAIPPRFHQRGSSNCTEGPRYPFMAIVRRGIEGFVSKYFPRFPIGGDTL